MSHLDDDLSTYQGRLAWCFPTAQGAHDPRAREAAIEEGVIEVGSKVRLMDGAERFIDGRVVSGGRRAYWLTGEGKKFEASEFKVVIPKRK